MNLLVSACLLGVCCRYDGCGKANPTILKLLNRYHVIPVCPEQLGGLPTPREPSEQKGQRVVSRSGIDVTDRYRRGAVETLKLVRLFHCDTAVLREHSPSCGHGMIHDGSFSGVLIAGNGAAAALLEQNGIRVLGESEAERELL
jgi:uncharacterized protein YbbK (DUF523 family)